MSRTRYRIFEREYPYFVTCTVVAWLPVFAHASLTSVILDSWRFLQRERGVELFGYVIMENHLHCVARAEELAKQLGHFKSFTARSIIDGLEQRGFATFLHELRFFKLRHKQDQIHQLWQEGSHPEQIQSDDMMRQKLDYIHQNPVRRGYVDLPEHWRYSSARNYAGQPGLLDVITDWG
jgi:REP element-mobilizing transposase RayT